MEKIQNLNDLVGEELSAIIFVQDYVQFDFNGPCITSFADPIVQFGSEKIQFPAPGSRDALCRLIGKTVTAVALREQLAIEIALVSGILTIPLDPASRKFGDAASFHPQRASSGQYF